MKIKDNSILLIGPGESVKDLDTSFINDNIITLAFSGNFITFQEKNLIPDYWTFLDPNTIIYLYDSYRKEEIYKKFTEKLKSRTILLYNDFIDNGNFYNLGFTTSRGEKWLINEFTQTIFPEVKFLFKKSIKIPSKITDNYDYDFNPYHSVINSPDDKFSKFLLPLVFYYFPDIKNIYTIGFGDFNAPRYNCSIKDVNDYEDFKISFNSVKSNLSDYLSKNKKQIIFLNPESYFNQL